MRRRSIDRNARRALLGIAAGRLAIGLGALLAPRTALRATGMPPTGPESVVLARLAGGRDVTLAVLTLAARGSGAGLRRIGIAAAAADAADAVVFGFAGRRPEMRLAGVAGVLSGAGSAAAGAWALARLRA
jgi:hypothetical protein